MEFSKMVRRLHLLNAGNNMKKVLQQLEFHILRLKDIPLLPGGEMTLTLLLQESFASNHTASLENWNHQLILSFALNSVLDSMIWIILV